MTLFRTLTEDDILRYEGVTNNDIINAFASVKKMGERKNRGPHSADIESFTQNVYEPGFDGGK